MIESFALRFGRTPGADPETVVATPVTVFVGPNNSGKSKILTEIGNLCRTGNYQPTDVILRKLSFAGLAPDEAAAAVDRIKRPPNPGEILPSEHVLVGQNVRLPKSELVGYLRQPDQFPVQFCQYFLGMSTLMLDGRSRIDLVSPQQGGNLQEAPVGNLQVLFRDFTKRNELRRIVREAFGSYLVIDPTFLGQLRFRLSDVPPRDDLEERGLDEKAVRFHKNAREIELQSDGVKAFTGIMTALIAGDPRVVLIDEPEAFLHPSLASKLGYEVSRVAIESKKRVFASTHSPYFVMGCIQSGVAVSIVRLTYRNRVATARVLPSPEILELMRNPLLRSTGVLNGLFYEFVIVTESDSDRAFYEEINERLLRFNPDRGIPNCLFLNAQNKQTVQTIIKPLRKLGIPVAGIVDVDVLKEGGTNWIRLLESAGLPEISRASLGAQRSAIKTAMDVTGLDMKRSGGLSILTKADQEGARNLLEQLAEYGIFVVPGGELESWLKNLGVPGKGPSWLITMFERMGADTGAADYVKPTDSDVWAFVSQMKTWLLNPERKGMPE